MKKQYVRHSLFLILSFTLVFLTVVNAQYSFSPSTILMKNQALNTMTYDSIHISSSSPDTLNLNWELISYDTTAGSYFDFCSSGNCWIGVPDSGSFPPIEPGGFGWAGMHFWTGNVAVTCSTKIRIYEQGNPGISDTIIFVLNAGTNGIYNNPILNKTVFIYPNPSSDKISISTPQNDLFTIYIYNSFGQKLKEITNSSPVSLKELAAGTYFILLKDKDGNYFTRTIQKTGL